ncbi:MAG: RNase adapter RapZ [Gammaproteobacteria bacterium]
MSEQGRFLIISGLSGAGKTVALHALEDAGFYCVDNLPVGILPAFAAYLGERDLPHFHRVAVGVDARNPADAIAGLPSALDKLASRGVEAELIFVDANDQTLIQRFSETRRPHPLATEGVSLSDAIERERAVLDPIVQRADLRIDTSRSNVHELRTMVRELITRRPSGRMALQFRSFGFKKGVPVDADFVFDVRCLPNPFWELDLRDQSGRDAAVRAFLERQPEVAEMAADMVGFLETWIDRFEQVNRSYLTIAFGCTGGRHRSVYMAERVAAHFADRGKRAIVSHRDG